MKFVPAVKKKGGERGEGRKHNESLELRGDSRGGLGASGCGSPLQKETSFCAVVFQIASTRDFITAGFKIGLSCVLGSIGVHFFSSLY